jgi:glycosyltransferase involved in cell wall biosynthesis
MRITYLHQYFNTPSMAGATRSYEMARRLVAKGHQVNMVTAWRENDRRGDWFETNEAGIRVHWLPVPYSNSMGFNERIQAFLRFAWGAARKAASLQADVVFGTSTPLTIALPAIYASYRLKIPMVFEVRDLWPEVPIAMGALRNSILISGAQWLEKFAYQRSTKLVSLAPTMRDFLSGRGVALKKIVSIPNGSDLDFFKGVNTESNVLLEVESYGQKNLLLYCGALGPAHGPEYLIDLANELLKRKLAILILVVGEGVLRKPLIDQAKAAGSLGKTILFKDSVAHSEISSFYSIADASLMTMAQVELLYRHSVQNKFFDSLAAGKPVFANYCGWASELAVREGAGIILDNKNISKATDTVSAYLKDKAWLEKAGHAARKLAEDHFTWDKLADQLEQVLLSAI